MLFYSLFKNLIILKICVSFLGLSIPFLYFPRPLNIFFLFSRQGFSIAFGSCPGTNSSRPCWPRTPRDLPASASRVLGLKACATTARLSSFLIRGGTLCPQDPLSADSASGLSWCRFYMYCHSLCELIWEVVLLCLEGIISLESS